MRIKNLNFFSSSWISWILWGLIALLATGLPLANAWFGFPFLIPFEGLYSAVGGVIPYSDANGYLTGAHYFNDVGHLESWSMRRPLNALFFAFRLKITGSNFWYAMALQACVCAMALTLYLRSLKKDMGLIATGISLLFIWGYLHVYIHTTLSEALGLSLGLLSFVLLWNGYLQKSRLIFNVGMASLAVALCTRAGPSFMAPFLWLIVFLTPFTQSRLKDVLLSVLSFTVPFIIVTKFSTFFGDPTGSGVAFANFASHVYGLVNGGKTWAYAYADPYLQPLIAGKNEAEVVRIFYQESWRVFKESPFNILMALTTYLGGFGLFFLRLFRFGSGMLETLTMIMSSIIWAVIGLCIYMKRRTFKKEFLFLTLAFLGITASAAFIWQDGGIRTFAVAIPFMGAFFGLAFASLPATTKQKVSENVLSIGTVAFIVLGSVLSPLIPSSVKAPEPSVLKNLDTLGQNTFLTYNIKKQSHLLIRHSLDHHFRTITPSRIREIINLYVDSTLAGELYAITHFKNKNLVLLCIYDYISHSQKIVLAEDHILTFDSDWVQIRADFLNQGSKIIYKANSYTGVSLK